MRRTIPVLAVTLFCASLLTPAARTQETRGTAAQERASGRPCQVAVANAQRELGKAQAQIDRALLDIKNQVVRVSRSCPNKDASWLESALAELAKCEAACTAAYNACINQPGCGYLCQLECSLKRVECNTGCNIVYAARAADCIITK